MKYYYFLFLLSFPVLPMDLSSDNKMIQIQVGSDTPFMIQKKLAQKCDAIKGFLNVFPTVSKYRLPNVQLHSGKNLTAEDLLRVFKIIQDKKYLKDMDKEDTEQSFFIADFIMAPEDIKFLLALQCKSVGIKSQLLDKSFNFEHMIEIDLSKNKLIDSPLKAIFKACPNIESINLYHNHIEKIDAEEIKMIPKKVYFLDLSHNRLTRFSVEYLGVRLRQILIFLHENYLSQKEVQRLDTYTKKRENAGLITSAMCFLSFVFNNIDFSYSKALFYLLPVIVVIGLVDVMRLSYQDLKRDSIVLIIQDQRA